MKVTPLMRAKPALVQALTGLALALALGLQAAAPAFAEDVVIPYECDARDGDVRLVPSEQRSYRVLGARDKQIYSACDPVDPGQCKNYQVHRFDLECGGVRVPWIKVAEAAARLEGERVSVKRNQMLLEVEPAPNFEQPYSSGRWDPDRRSGSGDPYGVAEGEAVVSFPPGFAPALGMKPVFTDGERTASAAPAPSGARGAGSGYGVPYDAAEDGSAGGWETEAKGWSESPRGEPLNQGARTGWDADKVVGAAGSKAGAGAPPSKQSAPNSTVAGAPKSGASYGTETVTSQQLPEIGAKPAKPAKAAPQAQDAAKAAPKKAAAKPAEAPPKEAPKAEPAKAEPHKSEPAKTEEAKAEAPKFADVKPDAKQDTVVVTMPPPKAEPKTEEAPAPKADVAKTETAMLEPPKSEVKPPDAAASATPQQPEMVNGKTASPEAAAKLDAPPAPPSPAPQDPARPVEAEATPPPPAAVAPAPAAEPAQPPVVAEATITPETQPSNIETSSISIVGQKVPLMPALFAAGAALVLGAGFFLMMRRDEDAGVAAYVERDIARVSLESGLGGSGARLSGPSFELPMPGSGGLAPDLPLPPLAPLSEPEPQLMAEALPVVETVIEPLPQVTEPFLPPVDAVMEPAVVMPEFDVVPQVAPMPEMAAPEPMPPGHLAEEPAPEAVELARALAEATAAPERL